MPQPALTSRPLTDLRLFVVERDDRGIYASALRDAGAAVTSNVVMPTADGVSDGPAWPDTLVVISDESDTRDMDAARRLRESGFGGLMLAVVPDASPEAATRWVFRGGVDDCLTAPADPHELAGSIADHLIRARNATLGKLSPFAPGVDDFPVPDLAEQSLALA